MIASCRSCWRPFRPLDRTQEYCSPKVRVGPRRLDKRHAMARLRDAERYIRRNQERSVMKIRLMGPPDIVRGWGQMIEAQFGVTGGRVPDAR